MKTAFSVFIIAVTFFLIVQALTMTAINSVGF